MNLAARQRRSPDRVLAECHQLWHAQPFRETRPAWCRRWPSLTYDLLALDDGEQARLFGSATQFTATVVSGSSVIYTWNFGDGVTTTGQLASHTYNAAGNYTAIVTATNQVSQMTASTTVEMVDIQISGLTASNSSPTIIGNQTFLAAATTSGSNVQYTWAFGGWHIRQRGQPHPHLPHC